MPGSDSQCGTGFPLTLSPAVIAAPPGPVCSAMAAGPVPEPPPGLGAARAPSRGAKDPRMLRTRPAPGSSPCPGPPAGPGSTISAGAGTRGRAPGSGFLELQHRGPDSARRAQQLPRAEQLPRAAVPGRPRRGCALSPCSCGWPSCCRCWLCWRAGGTASPNPRAQVRDRRGAFSLFTADGESSAG